MTASCAFTNQRLIGYYSIIFISVVYNAGKPDGSKDEFAILLPKLKTRVADTPANIAETLSKELAQVP